jgi:hypothetical protein
LSPNGDNIPLHEVLNRIAAQEGFGGWSLLAAKASEAAPAVNSHGLRDPNCGWRRARVIGNLGNETAAAGSHKFNPLSGGRLIPIVFD